MKLKILFAGLLLFSFQGALGQSLDLGAKGYGLSFGNSKRFTGIRLNLVDSQVERISGLNLTLWNPGKNPDAVYNGLAMGLIGTKSRLINGIALSGIGVNATERIRGIAAGTLGVGAKDMTGLAIGLIMVDVHGHFRGINISGGWTLKGEQMDGLALSLGSAMAKHVRGAAIAGFFAGGQQSFSGLALAGGGVFASSFHGLGISGFGAGGEDVKGVLLTGGGMGGARMDGIFVAGLGLGATERIRGFAFGSFLAVAPEVKGVMIGGLNGLYIDRIDLVDFLHFELANKEFTGLSIGLVNYSAKLKGVQIGLINYAANNPRWLRLLPLINLHF
jgi:hypothetical protein